MHKLRKQNLKHHEDLAAISEKAASDAAAAEEAHKDAIAELKGMIAGKEERRIEREQLHTEEVAALKKSHDLDIQALKAALDQKY